MKTTFSVCGAGAKAPVLVILHAIPGSTSITDRDDRCRVTTAQHREWPQGSSPMTTEELQDRRKFNTHSCQILIACQQYRVLR